MIGFVGDAQWGAERLGEAGDKIALRQCKLSFDRRTPRASPNYSETVVKLTVRRRDDRQN